MHANALQPQFAAEATAVVTVLHDMEHPRGSGKKEGHCGHFKEACHLSGMCLEGTPP